MFNRIILSLLLAVVLLASVSLLAGCGGGDADEDPPPPTEHVTVCSLPLDSTTNVCPPWKVPTQ